MINRIEPNNKQMKFGVWGNDEALELGMAALKKYQDSGKYKSNQKKGHRSLHLAMCEAYLDGKFKI